MPITPRNSPQGLPAGEPTEQPGSMPSRTRGINRVRLGNSWEPRAPCSARIPGLASKDNQHPTSTHPPSQRLRQRLG